MTRFVRSPRRTVPLFIALTLTLFSLFTLLFSYTTPTSHPNFASNSELESEPIPVPHLDPLPPPGPLPPLRELLYFLRAHPDDPIDPTIEVSSQSSIGSTPEEHNRNAIIRLHECLEKGTCKEKQSSIVLVGSMEFIGSAFLSWMGGEAIWASSIIRALDHLGYTFLFSRRLDQTAIQYRVLGDYVKVVVVEPIKSFKCLESAECTRTDTTQNTDSEKSIWDKGGIPAWKLFSFHFWGDSKNPLGPGWTMSPEPSIELQEEYFRKLFQGGELDSIGYKRKRDATSSFLASIWPSKILVPKKQVIGPRGSDSNLGNTYIGYSIEEVCEKTPLIPREERQKQAYVFAKMSAFFFTEEFAWSNAIFQRARDELNVTLLAYTQSTPNVPEPPSALAHTSHLLPQTEFFSKVAHSKILIGIGNPPLSPSPYDALCLGVPFLNPILSWNKDNPGDKINWYTQQNGLKYVDAPYVYNVFRNDSDGFFHAIQSAMKNPIDRFIPDHMRKEAMWDRVERFVESDWRSRASRLLEKRVRSGEGKLFVI
ncbi:hypothetical protein [Phaffia rhodozyma]|uniref:alpha-1,6-mannosyl-glycoprotein 6-beta-N-acetylglucosaminyltransferase n=1 Tax=Phaffia rhodozyma TaxID=264483 RepID=A0A0F7SFV2_PHARH|nr:hypothetical protein [Phaffia rhodozyma]